ncbi:MAG: hypothetical protein ABIO67_06695, partial [Mycobacteriales bacterium]
MTSPPDAPGRSVLLVEDGSGVTALAAARSLAAAGWRVIVGTPGGRSIATVSRSCHSSGVVRPVGSSTPQEWLGDVQRLAERSGAVVVVPCGDAELVLLSAHRESLPELVVPYPEDVLVQQVLDKYQVTELARSAGLRSPLTEIAVVGQPPSFDGRIVVKPRAHGPVRGPGRIEAVVVDSGAAALRRADEVRTAGVEAVYQQHVKGWLVAHVVVRSKAGVVLARAHQRASRVFPQPAGNCVRGSIEPSPPGLADAVDRMLKERGWWGLLQLEFLADAEGRLYLVDANPRPYGTLALAVGAGLPLCDLWLRDALGDVVEPLGPPRSRSYQALGLDLRRAAEQRNPSMIRDLTTTVAAGRGAVRPVWSAGDPRPSLRLAKSVTRRIPGRLRRGVTGR